MARSAYPYDLLDQEGHAERKALIRQGMAPHQAFEEARRRLEARRKVRRSAV